MIQSSCRKHPEPSRLRMLTAINLLMSLSGHLADVAKNLFTTYICPYMPQCDNLLLTLDINICGAVC